MKESDRPVKTVALESAGLESGKSLPKVRGKIIRYLRVWSLSAVRERLTWSMGSWFRKLDV